MLLQLPVELFIPYFAFNMTIFTSRKHSYAVSIIVSLLLISNITQSEYTMRIDKFLGRCPDHENPKGWFDNISISFLRTGDLKLDFNVVMTEPSGKNVQALFSVERCASKEALDTCSNFGRFKTSTLCKILAQKGAVWSSFLTCIKPSLVCPFKKGVYVAKNCTFDPNAANIFNLHDYYWRRKIETFDVSDGSLIYCIIFEGSLAGRH